MQVFFFGIAFFHGTAQTRTHTTGHHGFDGNLAWNAVLSGYGHHFPQHGHGAACKHYFRFLMPQDFSQGLCNQALAAGTAIVGGHLQLYAQMFEYLETQQIPAGPAADK